MLVALINLHYNCVAIDNIYYGSLKAGALRGGIELKWGQSAHREEYNK
jgi:hypothetical protein